MSTLELKPIPQDAPPAAPNTKPAQGADVVTIVKGAIEKGAGINQLTALYLKLRGAKKDLDEQAKAKMRPINEALEALEVHFLATMNDMGVDSLKNEAGTPYRSERVSVTVADNSAFVDFVLTRALSALPVNEQAREKIKEVILESGQLALIEARASKTAVEMFMQEVGELPPGLNRRVESTVNVRSA